jgi:O-antigen ligase
MIAPIGVSAYVAGFGLSLANDFPLITLAVCGAVAAVLDARRSRGRPLVLGVPVLGFLLATAWSLVTSEHVERGLQLSQPLLPGMLLFLVIAAHFRNLRQTRLLYMAFSIAALSLGTAVLLRAWQQPTLEPGLLVASLHSPLLLVPNDVTFLAVTAPLSLALVLSKCNRTTMLVVVPSLLVSTCAIVVLQSRVAALTMLGTLAGVAAVRSRRSLLVAVVAVPSLLVVVDAVHGQQMLHKFGKILDPRISLWIAALAMFRDAPWFGHGPHTFGLMQGSYLSALALPSWLPADDRTVPWAHNLYLELLAEQGIMGFIALAALFCSAVVVGLRSSRAATTAAEKILTAGALAGVLGICGAALVELSFLRQWVVVVTFTLFGVISHHAALRAPNQGLLMVARIRADPVKSASEPQMSSPSSDPS